MNKSPLKISFSNQTTKELPFSWANFIASSAKARETFKIAFDIAEISHIISLLAQVTIYHISTVDSIDMKQHSSTEHNKD